ncbi:MAG TPA: PaaI family thioesterase [Marmoricola sp.]|jgi:acyl-coenzyme A thioesterase PaaI-like protein|nr:PaaI family thioesterase [Marmoricola sp.]
MTEPLSLQEQYFPDLPCFGCGPRNAKGLRLRSHLVEDGLVVASFTPWPEHDNGLGFLNGGIIATVLDCHSAAAVTHEAYEQGWPALPGADLPYVTAGLDVRYLRPAPLNETVALFGRVLASSESEITAEAWIEWDGKQRARGEALWKRWRPRP